MGKSLDLSVGDASFEEIIRKLANTPKEKVDQIIEKERKARKQPRKKKGAGG